MTHTAFISAARFRLTLNAVLATAIVAAAMTPAAAGERLRRDPPLQAAVPYGDLDLETEAGTVALYHRLVSASRRVCPDDGARNFRLMQAVRECRTDALARAISAAGSTRLAALQASRKRVG